MVTHLFAYVPTAAFAVWIYNGRPVAVSLMLVAVTMMPKKPVVLGEIVGRLAFALQVTRPPMKLTTAPDLATAIASPLAVAPAVPAPPAPPLPDPVRPALLGPFLGMLDALVLVSKATVAKAPANVHVVRVKHERMSDERPLCYSHTCREDYL